jgi:hypothetical protein
MIGNTLFFVVAVPLLGGWLYLIVRYARANRRWFVRYMERDAGVRGFGLSDRSSFRFLQLVLQGMGSFPVWRMGPLMFRPDSDPEVERARQQAVGAVKLPLRILGGLLVLWVVAAIAAAAVLLVHWLAN